MIVVEMMLHSHLFSYLAIIFLVIGEDTMPSEVIFVPVEDLNVIPAMNTGYEHVGKFLVNHLFNL